MAEQRVQTLKVWEKRKRTFSPFNQRRQRKTRKQKQKVANKNLKERTDFFSMLSRPIDAWNSKSVWWSKSLHFLFLFSSPFSLFFSCKSKAKQYYKVQKTLKTTKCSKFIIFYSSTSQCAQFIHSDALRGTANNAVWYARFNTILLHMGFSWQSYCTHPTVHSAVLHNMVSTFY